MNEILFSQRNVNKKNIHHCSVFHFNILVDNNKQRSPQSFLYFALNCMHKKRHSLTLNVLSFSLISLVDHYKERIQQSCFLLYSNILNYNHIHNHNNMHSLILKVKKYPRLKMFLMKVWILNFNALTFSLISLVDHHKERRRRGSRNCHCIDADRLFVWWDSRSLRRKIFARRGKVLEPQQDC